MKAENFIQTTDINSIPQVQPIKDPQAAVNSMNSFYISHFFKLMYNTVDDMDTDSVLSAGEGEKIFREFLINEYSNAMSTKLDLTKGMLEPYYIASKSIMMPNRTLIEVDA